MPALQTVRLQALRLVPASLVQLRLGQVRLKTMAEPEIPGATEGSVGVQPYCCPEVPYVHMEKLCRYSLRHVPRR